VSNAPQGVEYLAPLLAILTIAISVPLVLEKVPPNRLYGSRTPKTLSNSDIWYEANYKGGITLLVASLISIPCFVVVMEIFDRSTAAVINMGVFIAVSTLATAVSLRQLRNL
jgi:hypothetical protein